jgi:rSAM/selenodomain-associated transferase 1
VKTRLAKSLGDDAALSLYRSFVLDTLDTLVRTRYPIIVCGHPKEKIGAISAWLGGNLPCWPQTGNSLGQKMANAFSRAFSEGFDQAVLIGSDIPDLPGRIIEQAFLALNDPGAALGPSQDGGYYLVAFCAAAFLPQVFEDIPWGTEQVLDRTLETFKIHNATFTLLEPWRDIDTIEDLRALLEKYPDENTAAHRTIGYLKAEAAKNLGGL